MLVQFQPVLFDFIRRSTFMESEDEKPEKEKCLKILDQLMVEEEELREELSRLQQVASSREAIMQALHEYNDIKDATQVVLGQLADIRGVTVKELHNEFDLPVNDS